MDKRVWPSFCTDDVVNDLWGSAKAGMTVPDMIRRLWSEFGIPEASIAVMAVFRATFGLSIKEVRLLACWKGFGGAETDEQIDATFRPLIENALEQQSS